MASGAELAMLIRARDESGPGFASARGHLDGFSSGINAIGRAIGTAMVAAGAGVAAGVGASVAAAAGFEAQMSSVKAVSGATAAEMEQLKAQALQLGADTSFSASEAAKGIEELIKAGVGIGDVLGGAASASLSLAAAGAVSVGDAAEIAANAMNQFGLKGTDLAHVADLIAGAANASAIDVNDFKFSLASVGAVANAVGFNFDDTAAAIALLGQAGIKGSDAGTSLKSMLLNLQPATKEQASLFRDLGLITASGANQFFDASGKVKSMSEVAGTLQTALAGMTQQQKLATLETIFGSDAIRAAAVFANQGAAGFNDMAASMAKVTAESVAAERLNNLKGDLDQLTGSLETAAIKIGTAFLPGLRSIVSGSTQVVNEAAPQLEAFAERAATALAAGGRQVADAWRTVQQVFGEGWEPSAEIEPLADAAGRAALAVKDLADFVDRVGQKASDMGAVETFKRLIADIQVAAESAWQDGEKLAAAIGRIGGSSQSASDKVTPFAAALQILATAADLVVINIGFVMNTVATMARIFADSVAIVIGAGKMLAGTLTGDMALAQEGTRQFIEATIDMVAAGQDWQTKTSAAFSAGMADIKNLVGSGSAAAAAEAERMGQGMVAGIEAAAPQMAAAAESGASGAVAAVEAEQGAAGAAGQGVGNSIGSGMFDGIRSWVGSVAEAAASLVSNAIGAARQAADSHSPSRKMQRLADDLMMPLEERIAKSKLTDAMKAQILGLLDAARDYVPVASEIARVEGEIDEIRDRATTEGLFRAQQMITIDSEVLRLKQAQVALERDLVPLRQDLARASREVSDIERGSLTDRTRLIEMDGQRKTLRLQEIELEKQLIGLDSGSKKAKSIQEQIDKLRDASRGLDLEAEKTRLTSDVAATAARVKREALNDQALGQQTVVDRIKDQIDTLGAEQAVFAANEAIIKNATENEIAYRNRLIAVFTAEGKPLADRILAGKALVEQLHAEGKISDELYDAIKKHIDKLGEAKGAVAGFGSASATAAPQIDAAAKKAAEMAAQAKAIAEQAGAAEGKVSALASSLGKLPDWFTPGKKIDPVFKPRGTAGDSFSPIFDAGSLSVPAATGGRQDSLEINVRVSDTEAMRIVVVGRELASSVYGGNNF